MILRTQTSSRCRPTGIATGYNSALQMARMFIACSGHRLTSDAGHHAVAFEAAGHLLGDAAVDLIDYFDVCRRKRNQIDYLHAAVASDTEAAELVEKTEEFRDIVEAWIASAHPGRKRGPGLQINDSSVMREVFICGPKHE